MREIKFRFYDKDNSQMYCQIEDFKDLALINGQFKPVLNNLINNSFNWYKRNYELMQYTGLKDKNGTEIYEGDIVKNNFAETIGSVMFADCGYWIKTIDKDIFGNTIYCDLGDYDGEVLEVIGNIYQNTELLKEGA